MIISPPLYSILQMRWITELLLLMPYVLEFHFSVVIALVLIALAYFLGKIIIFCFMDSYISLLQSNPCPGWITYLHGISSGNNQEGSKGFVSWIVPFVFQFPNLHLNGKALLSSMVNSRTSHWLISKGNIWCSSFIPWICELIYYFLKFTPNSNMLD